MTDRMCQKWFAKFRATDFSLDDAPWLGGPVEADSHHIETLIQNSQCYTTWEIADILEMSISIKLLVKIKNVYFTEKTKQTFWPTQYFLVGYGRRIRDNVFKLPSA